MKSYVAALVVCICLAAVTDLPAGVKEGQAKSAPCAACHGPDGNSTNPQWPKLAGQHAQYIYKQLLDFKQKERVNPIMNAQAADLNEQDMRDLGAYYAAQTTSPGSAGDEIPQLGARIYRGGVPERGVPACAACHGPAGLGNAAAAFPRLSYQHAPYVTGELREYASGERANDPAEMMRDIAGRMTKTEIEAVSQYVSGLHRAQ